MQDGGGGSRTGQGRLRAVKRAAQVLANPVGALEERFAHWGKPVLDSNGQTLAPRSCSGMAVADPEGSESSRSQQPLSVAAP